MSTPTALIHPKDTTADARTAGQMLALTLRTVQEELAEKVINVLALIVPRMRNAASLHRDRCVSVSRVLRMFHGNTADRPVAYVDRW
jgi:hypothetical protein